MSSSSPSGSRSPSQTGSRSPSQFGSSGSEVGLRSRGSGGESAALLRNVDEVEENRPPATDAGWPAIIGALIGLCFSMSVCYGCWVWQQKAETGTCNPFYACTPAPTSKTAPTEAKIERMYPEYKRANKVSETAWWDLDS